MAGFSRIESAIKDAGYKLPRTIDDIGPLVDEFVTLDLGGGEGAGGRLLWRYDVTLYQSEKNTDEHQESLQALMMAVNDGQDVAALSEVLPTVYGRQANDRLWVVTTIVYLGN